MCKDIVRNPSVFGHKKQMPFTVHAVNHYLSHHNLGKLESQHRRTLSYETGYRQLLHDYEYVAARPEGQSSCALNAKRSAQRRSCPPADGDLGTTYQTNGAVSNCHPRLRRCYIAWITGGLFGSAEALELAARTPVLHALAEETPAVPLPLSLPPLAASAQQKAQLHPPRGLPSAVVARESSCMNSSR